MSWRVELLDQLVTRGRERILARARSTDDLHARVVAGRLHDNQPSVRCERTGQRRQHVLTFDSADVRLRYGWAASTRSYSNGCGPPIGARDQVVEREGRSFAVEHEHRWLVVHRVAGLRARLRLPSLGEHVLEVADLLLELVRRRRPSAGHPIHRTSSCTRGDTGNRSGPRRRTCWSARRPICGCSARRSGRVARVSRVSSMLTSLPTTKNGTVGMRRCRSRSTWLSTMPLPVPASNTRSAGGRGYEEVELASRCAPRPRPSRSSSSRTADTSRGCRRTGTARSSSAPPDFALTSSMPAIATPVSTGRTVSRSSRRPTSRGFVSGERRGEQNSA